jgi:sarcosine oxidase
MAPTPANGAAPQVTPNMSAQQIVVIGLGATGSAALCQFARRGTRAIGIEQFAIGHHRGSSHGPTRIIRVAHFERPSYVPLMQRAYALWRELEGITKQKLLHITGILEIGPERGEIVSGTLEAAKRNDLALITLDANALMRRYPQFKIPQDYMAVFQRDGGVLEAERAIAANIRIAAAAGAVIRSGEKVLGIEPRDGAVRVTTDREAITADAAVIAAGPWMSTLLPELRLPLRVTRQVVGWFEPTHPAQFAEDRFPVFILESRYGNHYGLPLYGTMGVKIAKHGHRDETVAPDDYDMAVSKADEAAIRAPLDEHLPTANGRLLSAQTCLYTMTPDQTFIVDRMPGYPHIVIASPCSGHGFKFSPVIGEIVADLIMRGSTASDISEFRLQRFG